MFVKLNVTMKPLESAVDDPQLAVRASISIKVTTRLVGGGTANVVLHTGDENGPECDGESATESICDDSA